MIPIYKSTSMEPAIEMLAHRFERVLVRSRYNTARPVRIRPDLLEQHNVYFGRSHSDFDSQFRLWEKNGGVMVNYNQKAVVVPHEVQFICEAPVSLDDLHEWTKETSGFVTIFRPPTWSAHEVLLNEDYPHETTGQRFLESIVQAGMPEPMQRLCKALKIPADGLSAITDNALSDIVGVSYQTLQSLRRAVINRPANKKSYIVVQPLVARIEPEDRSLMEMYVYIRDTLPKIAGVSYAVDNTLHHAARFWKTHLKALVRSGSVEKGEKIGLYRIDQISFDPEDMKNERLAANARFARIRATIDAAPALSQENVRREFDLLERRKSQQQSVAQS